MSAYVIADITVNDPERYQEYCYATTQKDANRIAHVLLDYCGLLPGDRVLLRAPNSY